MVVLFRLRFVELSLFAMAFLVALAGFSQASFIVASNTTINSSITGNQSFYLNGDSCVSDVQTNLTFCNVNNTLYVIENKTQYFNQTVYINQTQYPQCSNHTNQSVKLAYADYGQAAFLNYSCYSGEVVNAPEFPNATVYVELVNQSCASPSSNATPVNTSAYNPLKLEKKLSCSSETDRAKGFTFVDFEAQQYVNFEIADCQYNGSLTQQQEIVTCQPYYEQGKSDKVCQAQTCPVVSQASGNPDNTPFWILGFMVLVYFGWKAWEIMEKRKAGRFQQEDKEIP